jgi:hypothetical protein
MVQLTKLTDPNSCSLTNQGVSRTLGNNRPHLIK